MRISGPLYMYLGHRLWNYGAQESLFVVLSFSDSKQYPFTAALTEFSSRRMAGSRFEPVILSLTFCIIIESLQPSTTAPLFISTSCVRWVSGLIRLPFIRHLWAKSRLPYKFYVLEQIGLSKQCRPRSDCFWRSSLIRAYAVCHSVSIFWMH